MGSVVYALLVPAFGLTQALIDAGNSHWLMRAVHLLMGIGAIFLVRRIEKCYQCLREASPGATAFQAA